MYNKFNCYQTDEAERFNSGYRMSVFVYPNACAQTHGPVIGPWVWEALVFALWCFRSVEFR